MPTDEYIKEGKDVAEKRIAKAGYRLANLLTKLWGNNQAPKTPVFLQ